MIIEKEVDVSQIKNAVLLFADVIDSSIYSSILGYENYAKKVLHYNDVFKNLAKKYFPYKNTDEIYCEINSKGDEGIIFCVHPDKPALLLKRMLTFCFDLKAEIELLQDLKEGSSNAVPKKMKLGIGIHFGPVSIKMNENKTEIETIIGYSINYAKRIESSSRIGKFSKIFLSREAKEILSGIPLITEHNTYSLKGIKNDEDVYEVRGYFINEILNESESLNSNELLDIYLSDEKSFEILREPWIKSLIISMIDFKRKTADKEKKENDLFKYNNMLKDFAWKKFSEEDPIIIFVRILYYYNKKEFTKALSYLKKIILEYPGFIHAKKLMISVFNEVLNSKLQISKDDILIRDMAGEMLEHYNEYLSEPERIICNEIIGKLK
ncbi:MAG: adenylate/guanylate cyclase domain-containing protein [Candidatus Gastranaerophilales bacterium]|nr:adenylate/guanylate cyclase domain-containing protein [Candidatus Gastranaerophilales bacterium]